MRSFLFLTLAALAGCGNYAYSLDPDDAQGRQRVTERAAGESVTVRIVGEAGMPAQALSVRADSTSWVDPATGQARTVATDQLRSVSFPGSDKGSFRGIAVGVGSGVATGALLGFLSYEFPNGPIDSRGDAAAFGAAGAGLIGGLIGGLVASDRRSDDLFIVRRRAAQ